MRCNAGVEGKVVEVIIDSGAEVTAMSRRMIEKLGYEIEELSNIIIKSANDQKERRLEIIRRVKILLEGEEIITDMEVIESSDELRSEERRVGKDSRHRIEHIHTKYQ